MRAKTSSGAGRRIVGCVATLLTVTAGVLTTTTAPAQAYATVACDPVNGTTSTDVSMAAALSSQLQQSLHNAMTGYRMSCARMVVSAVRDRGLSERAAVIAITTTIVESTLQNISETVDHDSLGLFQQRASWGSAANRLNATWATNAFLDKMLRIGSWNTRPIGEVCQAVQVSAYPDRYQVQAGDAAVIVAALWSPSQVTAVNGVVSGDITGDGRADVIGRKTDGTLWLYVNGGSDTAPYSTGVEVGMAWQQFTWFLTGDVTGDGYDDLIAARPDGTLWLYGNSQNASAPYSTGIQIGTEWHQFSKITAADVTGDGRADLMATRPDGTLWLYTNEGSNTAPYSTGTQIGAGWETINRVTAADVTGDGRADLVATRPDGTLWLYTNEGSNTAPYSTGTQIGAGWETINRVTAADVTGDGRADLVATRPDGTLWLYTNEGSNTAPYSTGTQIGAGWEAFA
jgi:hypothetical protein